MRRSGRYALTVAVLAWMSCPCVSNARSPSQQRPEGAVPRLTGPTLAGALRHLRFSPNGQYVLAQDRSRVTVLTAEPLAVVFSAPAGSATLAEFSPDSQEVLFVSSVTRVESDKLALAGPAAHVERWSITQRKRIEFTEVRSQSCGTLKLSPDGRTLGCVDFAGALRFIDVASGNTVFEKKGVIRPFVHWGWDESGMYTRFESGDLGSAGIEFSPDSRFALVACRLCAVRSPVFCWDAVARKAAPSRGELKQSYVAGSFVFVAPDRVLIMGGHRPEKSVYTGTVVEVPSAKTLLKPRLPTALWRAALTGGDLYAATDPQFVVFRLCGVCPAATFQYRTGEIVTTKSPVLDVLGGHYVAQVADDEIALYEVGKPTAVATVRLDSR